MDSGLTSRNYQRIKKGDKVLFCEQEGVVVFDCGAYGIYIKNGIDYDKIQHLMDTKYMDECCGNDFNGLFNDNFISLYEIYENFNCIENYLWVVKVI